MCFLLRNFMTVAAFLMFFATQVLFSQDIDSFWQELGDSSLNRRALFYAVRAVDVVRPPRDTVVTVIDFTLPSTDKRLWIIDLANSRVLVKTFVAHGKNTGGNRAVRFSNEPGSLMSSPGFFLTDTTYQGKHGYSLVLRGLEPGLNDNAFERAIVIHGAWYVSEDFIRQYGRLGRSWGCPAVPEDMAGSVIDYIKGGSLLFVYTSDSSYWRRSVIVRQVDSLFQVGETR